MITIAACISINVQIWHDGRYAGFSYPLLPVTGLIVRWWRLRLVARRLTRQVTTATTVARIGLTAVKFALVGG